MWRTALLWFVASGIWVGGLSNALPALCWRLASERTGRRPGSGHGVARNRSEASTPSSGLPAVAHHDVQFAEEDDMFIIGIGPHKGSHTALFTWLRNSIEAPRRISSQRTIISGR